MLQLKIHDWKPANGEAGSPASAAARSPGAEIGVSNTPIIWLPNGEAGSPASAASQGLPGSVVVTPGAAQLRLTMRGPWRARTNRERERAAAKLRQRRKRSRKKPLLTIKIVDSEWLINQAVLSGQLTERDVAGNPAKVRTVLGRLQAEIEEVVIARVTNWRPKK